MRALERRRAGEAHVIPVIVRACDWRAGALSELQALPLDEKPITSWSNRDEAWTDVVLGVSAAIENLSIRKERHAAASHLDARHCGCVHPTCRPRHYD
jgi:hypothetical protein